MTTLSSLNHRHKVGLALVLAATGLSLFLESSVKQTAGVALIGLAATWFFGSVRVRTLGLIFSSTACCIGLYLMIAPVWQERELYRTRAGAYNQALLDIRKALALPQGPWLNYQKQKQATDWFGKNAPSKVRLGGKRGLVQIVNDQDFLFAPPDEQMKYLSSIDSDFATAGTEAQREYLKYILSLSQLAKTARLPTVVAMPLKLEDLAKDPTFQGLSLAGKKQVLLAIGGDEIPFESPTTGKWKALPIDQWDEALRADYHPLVPSARRIVEIPASAAPYLRPDKEGAEWNAQAIDFPPGLTEEEILVAFQNNILMPRPTFSLRAAVHSHRASFVAGTLLFLLGLFGFVLLIWLRQAPRNRAVS